MKETIICDAFPSSTEYSRFRNGLMMDIINTPINSINKFTCRKIGCCSAVRQTFRDWYYFINLNVDKENLISWIEEISPIFPQLKMEFVELPVSKVRFEDTSFNSNLSLSQVDLNEQFIAIPIKLSEKSSEYFITNYRKYPTGRLGGLYYIVKGFINYCIDTRNSIKKDNYIAIINSFMDSCFDSPEFKSDNHIVTIEVSSNLERYTVVLDKIVDIDTIPKEAFIEYLAAIIHNNFTAVSMVINSRIPETPSPEQHSFLKVYYSNKISHIQGYLAHHLIRAGFATEFASFRKQYFLIKSKLPDIGFWNTIFLTQFGFNIYYYFWLTGDRTLVVENDTKMSEDIREATCTSSQGFLDQHNVSLSSNALDKAIDYYEKGEFEKTFNILSGKVLVELLEEHKKKFKNLRLSDLYSAFSEDDKYYFITGDDFVLRRYSKRNFKVI